MSFKEAQKPCIACHLFREPQSHTTLLQGARWLLWEVAYEGHAMVWVLLEQGIRHNIHTVVLLILWTENDIISWKPGLHCYMLLISVLMLCLLCSLWSLDWWRFWSKGRMTQLCSSSSCTSLYYRVQTTKPYFSAILNEVLQATQQKISDAYNRAIEAFVEKSTAADDSMQNGLPADSECLSSSILHFHDTATNLVNCVLAYRA